MLFRLCDLRAGGFARRLQRAGAAHDLHDVLQALDLAMLDRVADQGAVLVAAALHRDQQRQGRLALAEIISDVFAKLVGIALHEGTKIAMMW